MKKFINLVIVVLTVLLLNFSVSLRFTQIRRLHQRNLFHNAQTAIKLAENIDAFSSNPLLLELAKGISSITIPAAVGIYLLNQQEKIVDSNIKAINANIKGIQTTVDAIKQTSDSNIRAIQTTVDAYKEISDKNIQAMKESTDAKIKAIEESTTSEIRAFKQIITDEIRFLKTQP